ncbi:UNVERIFIED_CONTAM: Asparagine--tRNA ligase, cytoplasmic 3, partial [Sesamum indicum]
FLCQWLLDHCYGLTIDRTTLQRLEMVAKSKFHRVAYSEAVAILEEATKVRKFENKAEWGINLASEHENIVYNHPKASKARNMKVNEENKTVVVTNVLVPK